MRKLHYLVISVLTIFAVVGCVTKPMVQSAKCVDAKRCRSIGGYSIPSIVLDYSVSKDSAGVIAVTANERTIPGAWIPLSYLPGMSSDDSITYELDGGFLKSVGSIADDKSAAIVAEVLKIAKPADKPPGADAVKTSRQIAFTLDLSSSKSIEDALELLNVQLGLCMKADEQGLAPAKGIVAEAAVAAPGIYYPVERHWRVIIWAPDPAVNMKKFPGAKCAANVIGKVIDERLVLVPSSNALARIDIDRTLWVKHEITVSFEKGRLTKVDLKKPSEAAAFASIPADVLKTIVGIPAELIQLKIDTSGKDKALAEALKAKLDAEEAYIKALEDAKAAKEAKEAEDQNKKTAVKTEPNVDAPPPETADNLNHH